MVSVEQSCETLSIEEAARILKISRGTAYRSARNGSLPVLVFGQRRYRVPVKALQRLLETGAQMGRKSPL